MTEGCYLQLKTTEPQHNMSLLQSMHVSKELASTRCCGSPFQMLIVAGKNELFTWYIGGRNLFKWPLVIESVGCRIWAYCVSTRLLTSWWLGVVLAVPSESLVLVLLALMLHCSSGFYHSQSYWPSLYFFSCFDIFLLPHIPFTVSPNFCMFVIWSRVWC